MIQITDKWAQREPAEEGREGVWLFFTSSFQRLNPNGIRGLFASKNASRKMHFSWILGQEGIAPVKPYPPNWDFGLKTS